MILNSDTVKSEQLGSLGLVAAVIRKLGIIEKIDKRLELSDTKGGIVSYGQRAAAMILNGLGFMNSRLYMTTHFFQDKPVAQLLGAEITAEQLNDDCLGRCLDKIDSYGTTKLFSELAFEIASEQGLLSKRLHLDSTSFVLYGDYKDEQESPRPEYGYSKAKRCDLKQVMLSLTQGGAANLPLWMEALDGNSSDKKSFHETVARIRAFFSKLKDAPNDLCFVVDAAFYDVKKLKDLDSVRWITRVPAQLRESKQWLQQENATLVWEPIDDNYQAITKSITINELTQRWIMLYSKAAYTRELDSFYRRIAKEYNRLRKDLWHLSSKVFGCANDAQNEIANAIKRNKYHAVAYQVTAVEKYNTKGRPTKNSAKEVVGYKLTYSIASDLEKIKQRQHCLGRFILGTNQLEASNLSAAEVLAQYKEQSQVESGFKFIKDNAFELDSIFLKTPKRIGALMMIMTLCLMVYNFSQYHLRQCLAEFNDMLPNQHGKPTQKPTMKWVAEIMVVIAVVSIDAGGIKQRIVTNLNQVHKKIIGYFGKAALLIYGLPPDYKQTPIQYDNYKNFLNWCEM